jgi:hypothetical protein
MTRNITRAAALAALAGVLVLGAAACGDDDDSSDAVDATPTTISPVDGSGVTGTATLAVADGRLQGAIELSGLPPDTAHAMHIHGVPGEDHGCAEDERTTEHMAELGNIEADGDGDALLEVDMGAPDDTVRDGTYIMIHRDPMDMPMGAEGDEPDNSAALDGAMIIPVHAGEDHSAPAMDNPPIACGEFVDG